MYNPVKIGLLLCIILVSCYISSRQKNENFESEPITLYVITLKHENRLQNINMQNMKIHRQEIVMIDAVKGDELNIDALLSHKKIDTCFEKPDPKESKIKKRELGCYMSHLKTYKKIKEENRAGYSIVFEDDFDVANYYFIEKVQNIISLCKNVDFDIIFLGQVLSQNKGNPITENIYEMDKNELLLGTHGLLIRNSSIDRILDKVDCKIDLPIDHKLASLGKSGELTILVIYPFIVHQKGESTIQNVHISN